MFAAVSIYIYDHTPSGQSRLYKHRKSSVHGTISYVGFQQYYYYCFPPPDFRPYKKLLVYPLDRKPYLNKYVKAGKMVCCIC